MIKFEKIKVNENLMDIVLCFAGKAINRVYNDIKGKEVLI